MPSFFFLWVSALTILHIILASKRLAGTYERRNKQGPVSGVERMGRHSGDYVAHPTIILSGQVMHANSEGRERV